MKGDAGPALTIHVVLSMEHRLSYLWLTRFVPYPPRYGGDVTYTARLLEYLGDRSKVDVLCYREHPDDFPRTANVTWHLIPWQKKPRWRSVVARLPNVAEQYRTDAYVEQMLRLAETADAIIVDHLGMGWCAEILDQHFRARSGLKRPPFLFIPIDHNKSLRKFVASQVRNPVMRALVGWDALKASGLEDRAINATDGVVVLTDRDRSLFQEDHPNAPYLLVQPGYTGKIVVDRRIDALVPERICVLGGRGTFHKQIVLQQCLEALARRGAPAEHVDIVGSMDAGLQADLQTRFPGLTFRGYIEDIEAYLATVRMGILPDAIGGGFKLRALTYAFNRVPMVAVEGALAGMGFTAGTDYVEAKDLDSMVDAARGLVKDFDRLNRVQESAFRHCQGQFDWKQRAADLDEFAMGLARGRAAA